LIWYEINFLTTIDNDKKNCIELYKAFLINGGSLHKKTTFLNQVFSVFLFKIIIKIDLKIVSNPLSPNSSKRHLSSIKNFFEFLKQTHEGHSKKFNYNPVKEKIHTIKVKEIDIINTTLLPREQWRELIESTYRTRERLILLLLYWGGLRLSELTQLRYSNFDFKTRLVRVQRKGGYIHEFRVQQEEEIFKNIKFMKENLSNGSDFIFINYEGNCLSTKSMYNLIKKLLSKVENGHSFAPHSFRKACATNLYEKTKDLLLVRDYLNHKDAKVTQTYIESKKRPII
jgi:integrase/recombinase XerC